MYIINIFCIIMYESKSNSEQFRTAENKNDNIILMTDCSNRRVEQSILLRAGRQLK